MSDKEKMESLETNFATLPLCASMLDNLKTLEYLEMTAIQAKSLPLLLDGKDVIARAKTGSGKTAAFGIHLMESLKLKLFRVQSLVLCPTRELADQVSKELRRLARFTQNIKIVSLCGGKPFGPQVGSLEHGAHIVVGTPGRLLKHLIRGTLSLSLVKTLVLDEADRMLGMGFGEEVEQIIRHCSKKRQTVLFSATYPDDIQSLSASIQVDPIEVVVEEGEVHKDIKQIVLKVDDVSEKLELLNRLLLHHQPESTLIFCNMKARARDLADDLYRMGFHALATHGDLEQAERDEVLVRFANKSTSILVATDVAARGLDINDLQMVVMFDVTRDPEVHVHRMGRTGRAGKEGLAVTLACKKDSRAVDAIEAYMEQTIRPGDIDALDIEGKKPMLPKMVTLCIDGGRKKKVRPGDILGALAKDAGLPGELVGKINVTDYRSYIAVDRSIGEDAFEYLRQGKVKGRSFRVKKI